MLMTRINARLSGPLAVYLERMVGEDGLYETPSEYIRDLIRRDMMASRFSPEQEMILDGYRDFAEGRFCKSTGDFKKDMKIFEQREKDGWR